MSTNLCSTDTVDYWCDETVCKRCNLFVIMKGINAIMDLGKKKEEAAPLTRKCPYCMGEIDIKATKCMHCTSDVPPAQE